MLMNRKWKLTYNVSMAILAVISIALISMDYGNIIKLAIPPYSIIDNLILAIFTVDYFVRLILSKNKWSFFKNNIFDLLSIIPSTNIASLFRIARIGRLLKLLKILRVLRLVGLTGRLENFLKVNGLLYYLYTSIVVLLITSSLYCSSEKVSFPTALWWSITTATTVGYGDISPITAIGKIAAVINMLLGIGLVGMLTSSITNIFAKNTNDQAEIEKLKEQNNELLDKLEHIEKLLEERN